MGLHLGYYIPVGPREKAEYVADTIQSILYFADRDAPIFLLDDSGAKHCEQFKGLSSRIEVFATRPHVQESLFWGRLANEQLRLYKLVVEETNLDGIVRMDCDSLAVGARFRERVEERIKLRPRIGMLGDYLYTFDGTRSPAFQLQTNLASQLRLARGFRYPAATRKMKELLKGALSTQRYVPGACCRFGACVLMRNALEFLTSPALGDLSALDWTRYSDDALITLLMHQQKEITIEDFCRPGEPIANAHEKMPYAPEQVLAEDKCLVHSVRSYEKMNEDDVRAFFRSHRSVTTGI